MTTITQQTTKFPTETIQIPADFNSFLVSPGEVLLSVVWSIAVLTGTDPLPSAMLQGAPTTVGNVSYQLVGAGLNGVTYAVTCTGTTTAGQVIPITSTLTVLAAPPANIINSRQDLADYALRKLGAGVINIEVSNDQINDAIDDAIRYYHEYHFDGMEHDYIAYQITGTQITVSSVTGFAPNFSIASLDGTTTALIQAVSGNVLTTNKQLGMNKFKVGDTITLAGNPTVTTTITNIVLGDVDNGYITMTPDILAVTKILNITSVLGSADYMFNVQYQIMMAEIQNLTSMGMAYFYGVQNYLGQLDFVMKKEKDFRFNRRMDKLYLDINWAVDTHAGDIIGIEVYRSLDPDLYPAVYSDIWLRKYTTAIIKKVWGSNLRKYQGMQLPGGVTFNGQIIYDEAVGEIEKLEYEAINSSAPLFFAVG